MESGCTAGKHCNHRDEKCLSSKRSPESRVVLNLWDMEWEQEAYLRCEIIEKWGMIPWWLDVRVLDGYVSILKLRRLTRGVYGWRLSLLGCILKLHWSSIQVDAGAGECMSVGFCSPPLGYIRGFRRSFQDRMSAQPGFILCPPNNLALHRLLLYTFYSAPYLHNIVLFTRSHHTFEDFILCRQKSYTLVYFGCPVGNAHPYHSPQPTYILRSKISSALHQQMLSVQVNPDTLPYSSPLLLLSSPFH